MTWFLGLQVLHFTTIDHDRSMPDGYSLLHQKRQQGPVSALQILSSFATGEGTLHMIS